MSRCRRQFLFYGAPAEVEGFEFFCLKIFWKSVPARNKRVVVRWASDIVPSP
jgi:hypothetical protein